MFARLAMIIALISAPLFGWAQSADRTLTLEVDATVRSVDPETRQIVLENTVTGESEYIYAGPEVVNFDQIEVGDLVQVVYTLGIAARMAAPGEVDSVLSIDGQAEEGAKPGAMAGTAVTLILEFVSFDAEASVATVITSAGVQEVIDVASDAGRAFAADLQQGDTVALTFTEGLAVGIVEK